MMWHFYEIPYIPDLELVKYQSLGEQGIDGILERHNRFLRQWQRNTVLIHTTLHFFLSYTHERPKGSRLQIFLAFSSDQTVNFESIDALMQASPLADYYKIAPIEDVPVCLRKSFANILLVKKQEQTRLSTGDTLFTVEGWKSNPKSRLYEMEKTAEALNEDMVYHISIYGSDTYKTAQQALQKPIAILREKALGRSGQITLADNKNRPRDVSAEETLRIYEEFLSDVAKSPCFFANILLYANQKSSAHFLMDAVCGEAIKEGTCEIQEIPSTATPLELQEVNQPYCNLLPPSLAFWPTAYAFDVLMDSFEDTGKFDFSAVDSLSDELKSSDSYKQEAADVVNLCCEALVKLHQKCCISIRFVMQTIHNLQRFADIVPSIRGLDRHYDAFFPVDNADCSFLTDFDSIAEGLEAAKNDSDNYLAMVGSNSPLSRLAALKDILKSEDYVAAVSNLLFADQEVAPYAGMKKMILCLSMEETDEATALLLDTYCTVIMNYLRLSTAKEKVGKDNPFISASTEQILPIDLLIAQSIKSSKSGSPQEVDTNLDEFLEYYPLICTSSWEDQLFILQKVFAYLKMYSQERKVLEFLVKNNIPRTEQIDRRLNFLKNLNQNDISNAANSIEEFSIQTSDNEIAYDYRFISWTVSEINSYMNLLTSEDKTLDLPMVVAEWNKKIPQKNIRWSTDAMQVYLDKYLHENFGDLYTTKIKNCGAVLSNEVEYEPSVYIEATDSAKYPWLSFVVTGEQLTMTQVSFAIYALYLPTKDSQCTQAVDTIEQNQKYQNRLITLKQAQNPKIKNYIESINEILISGLEAWLNNNNTSSMYD